MKSFVINYPGEREPANGNTPEKAIDAISVIGAVEHDSIAFDSQNDTAVYISIESLNNSTNGALTPFIWGSALPDGTETTLTYSALPADESPTGKPCVKITLMAGLS